TRSSAAVPICTAARHYASTQGIPDRWLRWDGRDFSLVWPARWRQINCRTRCRLPCRCWSRLQGCVLYIAVERGAVVQRRVLAWCQHHAHMDIPLAVVAEMIDLRTGQVDADRIIATAKAFAQAGGLPV